MLASQRTSPASSLQEVALVAYDERRIDVWRREAQGCVLAPGSSEGATLSTRCTWDNRRSRTRARRDAPCFRDRSSLPVSSSRACSTALSKRVHRPVRRNRSSEWSAARTSCRPVRRRQSARSKRKSYTCTFAGTPMPRSEFHPGSGVSRQSNPGYTSLLRSR
jgi:hypothetical protein